MTLNFSPIWARTLAWMPQPLRPNPLIPIRKGSSEVPVCVPLPVSVPLFGVDSAMLSFLSACDLYDHTAPGRASAAKPISPELE